MRVRNPRTGASDYAIDPLDADRLAAVAADLRQRQHGWAARTPKARAALLLQVADALEGAAPTLTAALIADTGRQAISGVEVAGTIAALRRWAARAPALIAEATGARRATSIPGISTMTRLHPYPLVGAISPWNFPLTLAMIDAVPALAAGCAALVKPSEVTPRFIAPLVAALATVPEVPIAVVEGDGTTGAALVPLVDFIAFTGSVATGRRVAAAAAEAFIPASLELGGKDPLLVLASADPVAAAAIALRGSVVNTGQACQSIERVLVAEPIADAFTAALVAAAEQVRLNDRDVGEGDIGPFIFERQAQIVQAQIDDALAKGARLLTGGRVETLGGGLYLRPTVLVDVTPAMAVLREETFGPVIPVERFADVHDAVGRANAGEYGLSAAVLAATVEEAEDVAVRLRAGAVSINDASLTAFVWEAEKSSFGASGLGPGRMGDGGLLRFFRRQALIRQAGAPAPLAAFAENRNDGGSVTRRQ